MASSIRAVVWIGLAGLAACTSEAGQDLDPDPADPPPATGTATAWPESRCDEVPFVGSPIAAVDARHLDEFRPDSEQAGVALLEGACGSLDAPVLEMSWFSVVDADKLAIYGAAAAPFTIPQGAQKQVEISMALPAVQAPAEPPASGGAFVNDTLVLVHWPSARAFVDMVMNDGYLDIAHLKEESVATYLLPTQEPVLGPFGPFRRGPALVLQASVARAELDAVLAGLVSDLAGLDTARLYYVGASIGWLVERDGAGNDQPLGYLAAPWIDATIILEVDDEAAGEAAAALPSMQALLDASDASVVIGGWGS